MKSSKVTHFSWILLWFALLFLAMVTRFYDLANKPIHFDESINGWFVMQMQSVGYYKYDPNNYHGPLYFYILQFFEFLWGRSLEVLRAVPAFFSFLSVMVFSFGILSSKPAQRWMMFFIFVSPAFLFFGRSGIHEMPFVFFQILFALGFLRWFENADDKALGLMLVGLWGMSTLKETFVITLFGFALAFLSLGSQQWRAYLDRNKLKQAWTPRLTVLSAVLALLFVQLFTGFFKNPSGLVDFVKAFLPWAKTGVEGKGHEKVFTYWLQVFWEAEPLILLGVGVALWGVFSKTKALRAMSVFSLSQLFIYSVIPYKTVWCVLSLVWGFYFVLAFALIEVKHLRWFVLLLSVVGMRSAYTSVYQHPIWMEHPYVYVNSTQDLTTLYKTIMDQAKTHPEILQGPVQIGMKEQWPWPWLLRSFKNFDYNLCSKNLNENALIYFCDLSAAYEVDHAVNEPYWKLTVILRQSREASLIYLKKSAFPEALFKGAETVGEEE
ncbi:flippase activity-associated protein Agl23 [Bdellovibrio sp. BCCA]|uniref:flippase activity-associated protein Agl23 n=1 Tax=Bdellovibrio sp. BCCA TaxID=3136281 RepID=UPI0030F01F7D